MGVQARSILKNWFKNGDKPTQAQFADWIDSFVHKNEDTFSVEAVQGLNDVLSEFASLNALNAHISDTDAHGAFLKDGSKTMTGDIKLSAGLGLKWGAAGFGQSVDTRGFKFKPSLGFGFDVKSNLLTADRVYTLQDESYVLAGKNIDNNFSSAQTFTDAIKLTSTSAGITLYNTVDQVTNTESLRIWKNDNIWRISSSKSGTGVIRDILLSTDVGADVLLTSSGNSPSGFVRLGRGLGTGIAGTTFVSATVGNVFSNTAGQVRSLAILHTVNNSGTGGSAGLWISPRFISVGSGQQYLIDAGVNSAASGAGVHTSKFSVDYNGNTFGAGNISFTNYSLLDADAVTYKTVLNSPVTNILQLGSGFTTAYLPSSRIRGAGAGGVYTQTADLTQWLKYDGTTESVIAKIDNKGSAFFGKGYFSPGVFSGTTSWGSVNGFYIFPNWTADPGYQYSTSFDIGQMAIVVGNSDKGFKLIRSGANSGVTILNSDYNYNNSAASMRLQLGGNDFMQANVVAFSIASSTNNGLALNAPLLSGLVDLAGLNTAIASGRGTGAGNSSRIVFLTPTVGTSGTGVQVLSERFVVESTRILSNVQGVFPSVSILDDDGITYKTALSLTGGMLHVGSGFMSIKVGPNFTAYAGVNIARVYDDGHIPMAFIGNGVGGSYTQTADLTQWIKHDGNVSTKIAYLDKDAKAYFPSVSVTDPKEVTLTFREAIKGVNHGLSFSMVDIGSGFAVARLKNIMFASSDPGTIPNGTFCFYVDGSNLKVKNASGTVVTII